jgi:hypothetical protein
MTQHLKAAAKRGLPMAGLKRKATPKLASGTQLAWDF